MTLRRPAYMQASGADTVFAYSTQEFREVLPLLVDGEGVQNYQSFRVHQRAAGANFTVEVEPGTAIVQGDSVADQGMYLIKNTSVASVTVPAPPGAGTRTHRVIVQIRDKAHDGALPANTYDYTLTLQEDTGSGTPALPNSALALCTISVAAGTASITDSLITNVRFPADRGELFCGVSRVTNQSIPNNSTTTATFTTEDLDLWDMSNLVANNTRITIRESGVYEVMGYGQLAISSSTKSEIAVAINGTAFLVDNHATTTLAPDRLTVHGLVSVTTGNYLELQMYQNSGASVNLETARLRARWVCRNA